MENKELEQTLVLIKPDALKNSLTGYVLSTLSEFHSGLRFAGAKIVHVSRLLAEEHYAEHKGKPFYPPLLDYIMGRDHYPHEPHKRRVIALVYQGPDAVQKMRDLVGPTNPLVAREKKPGCIRALGTLVPVYDKEGNLISQRMDNLIHASATTPEAEREIKLWFKPNDIPPLMQIYPTEECDSLYYFRDGQLFTEFVAGGVCLLAPGDIAWASDVEALRLMAAGRPAPYTLGTVAAKYLINESRGE